jgi:hypothetical protein
MAVKDWPDRYLVHAVMPMRAETLWPLRPSDAVIWVTVGREHGFFTQLLITITISRVFSNYIQISAMDFSGSSTVGMPRFPPVNPILVAQI